MEAKCEQIELAISKRMIGLLGHIYKKDSNAPFGPDKDSNSSFCRMEAPEGIHCWMGWTLVAVLERGATEDSGAGAIEAFDDLRVLFFVLLLLDL